MKLMLSSLSPVALATVFLIFLGSLPGFCEGQSTKPNLRGELLEQWDRKLGRRTSAMLEPNADYDVTVLWTVGQTSMSGYTPPGIFDGMGAYAMDDGTIRLLVNHELRNALGYEYTLDSGLTARGARVSYFDIDPIFSVVKDAGLAYHEIIDIDGDVASEPSQVFLNNFTGYSRFCSGRLVKPGSFASGSGVEDLIYFAPEEDGGRFNINGGHFHALHVMAGTMWDLGALGRGAWENLAPVDTGDDTTVAFILADDTSPFDFDPDADDGEEVAPLYLYVGTKDPDGDFLARNGLRGGDLHVLVPDDPEKRAPSSFRGARSSQTASWVKIDNTRDTSLADTGNATGYDDFGYPRQGNLFKQAKEAGAFGFSRPEDVHENPLEANTVILASTGVDTYDINDKTGNGFDTWGTLYAIATNFSDMTASLSIVYDGNQDKTRFLRSPDNLSWSPAGKVCVQEDEAEESTASLDEVLFTGPGISVNSNEAGIVCFDIEGTSAVATSMERVANIDRSVVLDFSLFDPEEAVDVDKNSGGEWESSGIIDVSSMFNEPDGTVFIVNVQAHGIEKQDQFNSESRITDDDLVEGGQLLILEKKVKEGTVTRPGKRALSVKEEDQRATVEN